MSQETSKSSDKLRKRREQTSKKTVWLFGESIHQSLARADVGKEVLCNAHDAPLWQSPLTDLAALRHGGGLLADSGWVLFGTPPFVRWGDA